MIYCSVGVNNKQGWAWQALPFENRGHGGLDRSRDNIWQQIERYLWSFAIPLFWWQSLSLRQPSQFASLLPGDCGCCGLLKGLVQITVFNSCWDARRDLCQGGSSIFAHFYCPLSLFSVADNCQAWTPVQPALAIRHLCNLMLLFVSSLALA